MNAGASKWGPIVNSTLLEVGIGGPLAESCSLEFVGDKPNKETIPKYKIYPSNDGDGTVWGLPCYVEERPPFGRPDPSCHDKQHPNLDNPGYIVGFA